MLLIRPEKLDQMRGHAEQSFPQECCGVLLGQAAGAARSVADIVPCRNARLTPETRYSIDPRDLVRIQREARALQLDIVGFYHSHPGHSPRWSATDLEEAHWLGCSYVIISVEKGQAGQIRAFHLAGADEEHKRFEEEPLGPEVPENCGEGQGPSP
jgi:proteasome lid subunit RPN8/RPN11